MSRATLVALACCACSSAQPPAAPMHVMTAACSSPKFAANALALVRSVYESSTRTGPVHVHVIHDDAKPIHEELIRPLETLLAAGSLSARRLRASFYVTSARTVNANNRNQRFASCASTRLLIGRDFPALDAVLYIDADVYVDGDLWELWRLLGEYNRTQWLSLAQESESATGWYARWPQHHAHAFEPHGLNSGVMLVNLTRWRERDFTGFVLGYDWKAMPSELPDQDLLNVYFRTRREEMYVLPCRWNMRTDSDCAVAEPFPGGIWHGKADLFWNRLDGRINTTVSPRWEAVKHWLGHHSTEQDGSRRRGPHARNRTRGATAR